MGGYATHPVRIRGPAKSVLHDEQDMHDTHDREKKIILRITHISSIKFLVQGTTLPGVLSQNKGPIK